MTHFTNGRLAGAIETELARDSFNTVGRVDVLDQSNLPAGSSTLTRRDNSGGQEIFPDLEKWQA